MPTLPPEFQEDYTAAFAAMMNNRYQLELSGKDAVFLLTVVQLASRHPQARTMTVMERAIETARRLQDIITSDAPEGPLSLGLEMGWHEEYDEVSQSQRRTCRLCACTDADCSGCVERTGEPCFWITPDLCSACLGYIGLFNELLWFSLSPDAGDARCICSRCRSAITADEFPIRAFANQETDGIVITAEARFCDACSTPFLSGEIQL